MAPNVKEVADVLQSLDLQQYLVPKYAPLTTLFEPQEPCVAAAPSCCEYKEEEFVTAEHDCENYWDWQEEEEEETREQIIARIVRDEAIRELLCVHRITDNAIESCRSTVGITDRHGEERRDEGHSHYWTMPCAMAHEKCLSTQHIEKRLKENDRRTSRSEFITAPHVGVASHPDNDYWDWPTLLSSNERRRHIIRAILKEEASRALLSTSHIEENLLRAVRTDANAALESNDSYWDWNESNTAEHAHDATHPLHNYWDQHSAPTTCDEARASRIARIIADESIRHVLSSAHMEANEIPRGTHVEPPQINGPVTDFNYWHWNNEDVDTLIEAPHCKDATHSAHSYWDHDTSRCAKKYLIAKIMLEHEIREMLSSSRIIDNAATTQSEERYVFVGGGDTTTYWHW